MRTALDDYKSAMKHILEIIEEGYNDVIPSRICLRLIEDAVNELGDVYE